MMSVLRGRGLAGTHLFGVAVARHVIAVLDGEEPDAASLARLTELAA